MSSHQLHWWAGVAGQDAVIETAHKRVLVVEDHTVIRQTVAEALDLEVYLVDAAPDGAIALERVRTTPPDAMIRIL